MSRAADGVLPNDRQSLRGLGTFGVFTPELWIRFVDDVGDDAR